MAHNVEKEIDGVIRTVTELDHTAQEIDDAVEVTKVHSNPQLLDNWYWADPDSIIDQRGGWIVPYGTPFYSDVALSAQVTTVQAPWFAATYINETYGSIYTDNQTFYVRRSDMVRGYAGPVYSIDRWFIVRDGSIVVSENEISFETHSGVPYFCQPVGDKIRGKTVTLSVLGSDGNLHSGTAYVPETGVIDGVARFGLLSNTCVVDITDVNDNICVRFFTDHIGSHGLKAVKLEFGSQQTLARQDENGNWVLIDPPPNKQQELAKCQRHQIELCHSAGSFIGIGTATAETDCKCICPIPVTLRSNPQLVTSGNFVLYSSGGVSMVAVTNLYFNAGGNGAVGIGATVASGLTAGQPYKLYSLPIAKCLLDANL